MQLMIFNKVNKFQDIDQSLLSMAIKSFMDISNALTKVENMVLCYDKIYF
jgi:hypothetical protein